MDNAGVEYIYIYTTKFDSWIPCGSPLLSKFLYVGSLNPISNLINKYN